MDISVHPAGLLSMKLRGFFLGLVVSAALLLSLSAHAQGCAACRDNTAATSPSTQRAYRHAIILMAGVASTFFLVTVALLRKKQ
ncbi:hypothetical protein [Edaphobacter acidisoli]|uniref:hypothetical protein n=1 Tax=Edaphobacter acidisoli TaxID=2040573 RepID=UPI001663DED3|nr:hypothetical protein [Edaphobacter acidisoli]